MYSAGGDLLWSSAFSDLLSTPPEDPADPFDGYWWIRAITTTPSDTVVFAACRNGPSSLIRTEYRLIETDADGNVLASTAVRSNGIYFLHSGGSGEIVTSEATPSSRGGCSLWTADRSSIAGISFTTGGLPYSPAYPQVRDAHILSGGTDIITATELLLSTAPALRREHAAGGDASWATATGTVDPVYTVDELAAGKILAAGNINPGSGAITVGRYNASGVFEADVSPAFSGAKHARVTASPVDGFFAWVQAGSTQGFALCDSAGAIQWRHRQFNAWDACTHADGSVAVVGFTMDTGDEENFV